MDEKKNRKNERNFIILLLILIAFIILIFLFVRSLGLIDHKMLVPTGNVDIFDIIFQKDCDCNDNNNCNNNTGGSSNNGSGGSSSNGEIATGGSSVDGKPSDVVISEDKDGIEVFDDKTQYSEQTPLNIFTSTTYLVANNKIAPTSENSYQFVIRNHNESNIKYSLVFLADNKPGIDMRYRLKLNNNYVAGSDSEWLTVDELKQANIELSANTYDVYTLDWKWFESSNDTEVGSNINSSYKLELKITASDY